MATLENSESDQLSSEKDNCEDKVEVVADEKNIEKISEDTKTDDGGEHKFAIPALPTTSVSAKAANKKEELLAEEKLNKINGVATSKHSLKTKVQNTENIDTNSKNNVLVECNISKVKACTPNSSIKKEKKFNFPYTSPSWGGTPTGDKKYSLTILKEGIVKDTIDLGGKATLTFGRHPDACDVLIEHPSSSRHHAVLQYCVEEKDIRKVGYYLYDLGSTHGCYVNKEKMRPKVYVRVRVGYQIKFGLSSRLYIMEGPEEDQEEEIDMEEVRKQRLQHKQEQAKKLLSNKNESTGDTEDSATWGFGEDAEEEELDLQELMEKKKSVEVKDPKKTLKGFFEREGLDFEYETSERGRGNSVIHVVQVRLPIESSLGVDVIAEGTSSNKKDAVLNCAMDACKIIQAYDMMQNPCKEDERVKRQRELEANDFYDSDDDNFLDRTGSIEKKRMKRKQWAGKQLNQEIETHESLKENLQVKSKELSALEEKLRLSNEDAEDEDNDSLDAYMSNMKNKLDKKAKIQLKRQILDFKKDIAKLEKLVERSQPALPALIVESKEETTGAKDGSVNVSHSSCEESVDITESSVVKDENDEGTENPEGIKKQEAEVVVDKETTSPKKKKKKKRVYGAAMMPPSKKGVKEVELIEWQPPQGQTGDGRTHLNDKFGY